MRIWVLVLCLGGYASAATVTVDEVGLDAIFSQPAFGAQTIDIRIGDTVVLDANELLSIDDALDFLEVRSLVSSPDTQPETVQVFFVDTVDWCGGVNSALHVGCSSFGPIPNVVGDSVYFSLVEAEQAAGAFGSELIAHEISHTMTLDHSTSGLMAQMLDGDTMLTAAEANIILNSSLVQIDAGGQRFIEITPVLIPEPSGLLLVLMGGVLLRRRR